MRERDELATQIAGRVHLEPATHTYMLVDESLGYCVYCTDGSWVTQTGAVFKQGTLEADALTERYRSDFFELVNKMNDLLEAGLRRGFIIPDSF